MTGGQALGFDKNARYVMASGAVIAAQAGAVRARRNAHDFSHRCTASRARFGDWLILAAEWCVRHAHAPLALGLRL